MHRLVYAYGIQIIGTKIYISHIRKSLRLLKQKDPAAFKIVKKYIGRIELSLPSGMAPWEKPPTFYFSTVSAYFSLTWCASSILHDAWHSKLYLDYLHKYQKVPKRRIYSGTKIELLCIRKQLLTARRIGAPTSELEHLKSSDGKHHRLGKKQWW